MAARTTLTLTTVAIISIACSETGDAPGSDTVEPLPIDPGLIRTQRLLSPEDDEAPGRGLAKTYCQSCHLFTEPNLLTKNTLRESVLPFLELRLGIPVGTAGLPPPHEDYLKSEDPVARQIQEAADVYPTEPLVPLDAWQQIVDYYIEAAPDNAIPQGTRAPIEMGLPGFEVFSPEYRSKMPFTTLVKIDEEEGRLLVGDAAESSLTILDSDGSVIQRMILGNAPVAVDVRPDELWVTMIGSVFPSDHPKGELMVVKRIDGEYVTPGHRLLKRLSRPSFTSYADLNRDGREDIIMSEFGYYAGHLSWFEKAADGSYSKRLLNRFPGAISTHVYDFNGDGWPDIAALMGQAREGVFIYYNLGNGQFRESYEIQMPASYGSVHLSLVDFDGDGFVDVLTANGDNADYPLIMKRYHGIRLHLNDGNNHFREAFFYPLNGAYKALAVDFDQDGDRDIAAISFFPDYDNSPEEAFVFLQNEGGLTFRAYSFPEAQEARWLTMDAGDLDGDGDVDIALGAFSRGGSNVPNEMEARWREQGPSVLILENKLY